VAQTISVRWLGGYLLSMCGYSVGRLTSRFSGPAAPAAERARWANQHAAVQVIGQTLGRKHSGE